MRVYTDLNAAQEEWELFFNATTTSSLMMTWQYANVWWQTYGANATPLIVSLDDALFAPLMKRGKDLMWIGTPDVDSMAFLTRNAAQLPDAIRALARFLCQQSWSRLHLRYLPHDQLRLLLDALALPYQVRDETTAPTIFLRGRTWDEYFAGLSPKFRSDVRRPQRKAEKDGIQVRFETLRDAESVSAYFQIIKEIVNAGHIEDKKAMLERDFLLKVWRQYAECGWLDLNLCFFNEKVAAYSLNYVINGAVLGMSTGYRPEYRDYSPGKLLVEYTLRRSFKRGDHTFDMQHGPDEYKLSWTEESQPLTWVTIYRSPLMQQIDETRSKVKGFMKQMIRR